MIYSFGFVCFSAEEVDSEGEQAPGPSPIRVRFLRAETEKQKKRREESSLHRSKLIEQDPWIPLEIHSQKVRYKVVVSYWHFFYRFRRKVLIRNCDRWVERGRGKLPKTPYHMFIDDGEK